MMTETKGRFVPESFALAQAKVLNAPYYRGRSTIGKIGTFRDAKKNEAEKTCETRNPGSASKGKMKTECM